MGGETELRKLLAGMRPELQDGEFVFCTVSPRRFARLRVEPVGWFREAEGITLIVEKGLADDAGLDYEFVFRMITLSVHSGLDAVGFLAAVTARLSSAGISVNPVSAYHHDHLFVRTDQAVTAVEVLKKLGAP